MYRLASANEAYDLDYLADTFPTLNAAGPHNSRTDKYRHISTMSVLRTLDAEGFGVFSVDIAKTRDATRNGFQKHLLRLRHRDTIQGFGRTVGDEAPEITIINSHDGGSAWNMFAGIIRFACSNGLIVGTTWESVHVRHTGNPDDVAAAVVGGAYRIRQTFPALAASVARFKAVRMPNDAIEAFAMDAHALRYTADDKAPVSPMMLVDNVRREADAGRDLWTVYNRAQENLLQGGIRGRIVGANGRVRRATMRGIRAIDQSVGINRKLFDLADRYATELATAT